MSVDDQRINAMATARAVKAVRLYVDIGLMIGHPPTAADIGAMNDAGRHAAVRSAGVKVASDDTWKVVRAIAASFEGAGTYGPTEALPVDRKGLDSA